MSAAQHPPSGRRSVDWYGASLLISAFILITRGIAYTPAALRPETPPPGFDSLIHAGLPAWVFGVAWFVSAAACVYLAFRSQRSVWPFLIAILLPLVWGFSYIGATLFAGKPGWLTGIFYLALMGYIVAAGLPRVRR